MHAVIAGASGAIGSALARELASTTGVRVTGIARNAPQVATANVQYLQADLTDIDACQRALHGLPSVTHLYYCGRASHAEQQIEDVATNVLMLTNILEVLEPQGLAHVHLVQGGKVYGVHVGPFPTPARESDARAPIENFNYAHEDILRERSHDAGWTWSASRPHTLAHYSPTIARNLVSSLGAYAALCKALGSAFDFPGPASAYESLTQVTCTSLLARAIVWMSTTGACANEAFNINNGDAFRWSQIWPRLAQSFGLPCGTVRPMRLAEVMADRERTWQQVVTQAGLKPVALTQIANWSYLDGNFERSWDELFSTNKARQFGFHEWLDSEAQLLGLITQYRDARLLP